MREPESKDPYSFSNLSLECRPHRLLIPCTAQVLPLRITPFNQRNLSLPFPTFQLLFAGDGPRHFAVRLVIQKPVNLVLGGESVKGVLFVLAYPIRQVARDPDVQRPAETAENVNRVQALVTHGFCQV